MIRTRRGVALALIACGIVLMSLVAGSLLLTNHRTAVAQERLASEVPTGPVVPFEPTGPVGSASPAAPTAPVAVAARTGHALVEMTVPRFGKEWRWVVLEGTSPEVLVDGPGHYTGTPLPGAPGNVAIAGHRAGHGDPFIDFDLLRAGDHVRLQQGSTVWDYVIDKAPVIIPTTASWVLDPLPGDRLTLTTCWPKYGSSKRMYVRAHLAGTHTTSDQG